MMRSQLVLVLALASSAASAQVLLQSEDYEDEDLQGWTVNGQELIFPGEGNPGAAGGVPILDFHGITLSNDLAGSPLTGNLARHGGDLLLSVDIRTLQLFDFFGQAIDPRSFPVTLELVDDRPGPFPVVSVYITGRGMPPVAEGWERFFFRIPDPTSATLPEGWGGTGDEDPVTFQPRLPAGVTYASVLASVDRVRVTTFQPGYFYSPSFWEVRFDNILVERVGQTCDSLDFNTDGVFPDTADIADFLSVFGGGACSTGSCNDIDFNNDGVFPSSDDIEAFLRVFGGGAC